nr:DUF4129 domain-containing protein [Deinococcus aestuarii]
MTRTPTSTPARERQEIPPTPSGDTLPGTRRAAPLRPTPVAGPNTGTDLVLLGGVLFILSLVFALWRVGGRVRAGPLRFRWWEVAAILGLLLTAAFVVALGLAARLGDGGGSLAGAPGGADPSGDGDAAQTGSQAASLLGGPWLWWLSLLVFVVFVGLAGAVFWLALRFRPPPGEEDTSPRSSDPPPLPDEAATHRVRAAYRAALAALAGIGLGRAGSETPAEHADRAALALPDLGGPLGLLVAAYAPVRYGGRVTNEDADAAEGAARRVADLAAGARPVQATTEGGTA